MTHFRPKPKLHKLIYGEDDTKYPGLEVVLKAPSVEGYLELIELAAEMGGLRADNLGPEELRKIGRLFRSFAAALREWNVYGDDDQPVPATYEGVASQELGFVMDLFEAWLEAVGKVAPPLKDASSSGANSDLEASIPMEPISASHST